MVTGISLASDQNSLVKEGRFSIVVNAENKIDPLNPSTKVLIKQLYLKMKSEWPQGMRAEPIARPPDSDEQINFIQHVLGMTEAELADYWLSVKQRTGQTRPRAVSSNKVLFKLLSKHKGAFSIVDNDAVKSLPENVVVLVTIDNEYSGNEMNTDYSEPTSVIKKIFE